MDNRADASRHIHFVTGRLASETLRATVDELAKKLGFQYSIGVMPITVAALMTPRWIARHLAPPAGVTEIMLPGYCDVDIDPLREQFSLPIVIGPRDLRDLPETFGMKKISVDDYGKYSIEIIAEINHAPRMSRALIVEQALALRQSGADVIDLGCDPANPWRDVSDVVRALRDLGLRVSIDTFDSTEAAAACRAGAELVLSVNSTNRLAARDWGTEVVAVPDTPDDLTSLEQTIDDLHAHGVACRADPILEPIGVGFAESLRRYQQVRDTWPRLPMMMGIGNLTELTDVDSAGINLLLLGICQDLRIESVLTTQVINWARSSVRECDHARRLVWYANKHRVPPKRLDTALVRLRDPRLKAFPEEHFTRLSQEIRDANLRIFAQHDEIHLVSRGIHLHGTDPFTLMQQLMSTEVGGTIDPSHAFYLGFELSKALTALTLGKQYEQDEALRWGDLTRPEKHHRLNRTKASPPDPTATPP